MIYYGIKGIYFNIINLKRLKIKNIAFKIRVEIYLYVNFGKILLFADYDKC